MDWRSQLKKVYEEIKTGLKKFRDWFLHLSKRRRYLLLLTSYVVVVILTLYLVAWRAPSNFPQYSIFTIEDGQTLREVGGSLLEEDLIRSPIWFEAIVYVLGGDRRIRAGDYFFNHRESAVAIAKRFVAGDYGLEPIKVTVPEGYNIFNIAKLLSQDGLKRFDPIEFVRIAEREGREGYLFPDTYFFLPNIKASDVVKRLSENFDSQIKNIDERLIASSTHSFDEVIIIASIIEKEAHDYEDRRKIASVIYNRLEINMPLQVDVTFAYINGKNSYELTKDDLKTESPYNTYTNKGLPPTPIANPSLDSIRAALDPADTDFLYFLADLSNNVYFAKDFDGHQHNRERYLRQ